MADRQTIAQFLSRYPVTLQAERTDSNPAMDDSRNMDHWRCVLRHSRRRMTLVFSMGYGHNGAEPAIADVLDCLASDATGIDNARSFEEWASEYGYDTDSRKAERTFRACERQASKLRALLGDDAYQALLWQTDRE